MSIRGLSNEISSSSVSSSSSSISSSSGIDSGSPFDSLPNETIVEIFQNLPSMKDAGALARTGRRMNEIYKKEKTRKEDLAKENSVIIMQNLSEVVKSTNVAFVAFDKDNKLLSMTNEKSKWGLLEIGRAHV